jgi:hypothetical protein
MSQEVELLVSAIESLKQQSDPFKDYIFPIAGAFFTSLLGAGIAFGTLRHQESLEIEKEKMRVTNHWMLLALQAHASLGTIKDNYRECRNENPLTRLGAVPTILLDTEKIRENFSDLSFVVPKRSDSSSTPDKWSNINRIMAMFGNYNNLLSHWKKRNELYEEFKDQLIAQGYGGAQTPIGLNEILQATGRPKLVMLIDLTERVIKLTDDILLEFEDFLLHFPTHAKTLINCKRLKHYGNILTYEHNEDELHLAQLERMPEADFSIVEELFGESAETIRRRHKTGYEES